MEILLKVFLTWGGGGIEISEKISAAGGCLGESLLSDINVHGVNIAYFGVIVNKKRVIIFSFSSKQNDSFSPYIG
jgi:hypothetical protein